MGHAPSSDMSVPGRLGQVVALMEHLDTYVRGDGGTAAVRRERVRTHDRMQRVWAAMAASVGCGAVELESTDFDRGPAGRPGGHHRPDVTFELPAESRELYAYVTDVAGRWARVSTVHEAWEAGAKEADLPRAVKRGNYATGMERENAKRRELQLPEAQLRILSFAVNSGVWGSDTRRMFRELCARAKEKRPEADLYGWAAMTWRKHWEQRVGVVLARGRAGVLLAALQDRSERWEDGPELPLRSEPPATMEWSPDHGPGSPAVAAAEMAGWGSEMVGRSGAPCGGG